jgi:signal transduction histidine kinase
LLNDIQTRITPRIREAKITVETDYPSTLPILELDPELMGRVIHNILDNAIKFTPDGGQIEISAAPSEDNNCLILRFKDNGPGIPPDQIEKIFHKYHRVANIESRRSGSGLGLAFSRLVVEAHGGEIWAESQPGEGSAFIISLPIAE